MKKLLFIYILFLSIKMNAQSVSEISTLVCVKSNSSVYLIFKRDESESTSMPSLMVFKEKEDINSFVKDLKKAVLEDDESTVSWHNDIYSIEKNKSSKILLTGLLLGVAQLTKNEAQQLIDWINKQ